MGDIADVDLEQYLRDEVPYHEVGDELLDIEIHLNSNKNLLQYGPPGIGKSLSLAHYAAKNDIPYVPHHCSRGDRKSDIVVKPWTEVQSGTQKTVYIPSSLPLGILAANEYGQAIVNFEEINVLPPHTQKNLNELDSWRNEFVVPEANHTFKLNKDANLLIAATMNPPEYTTGVFELNNELRGRFSELERTFPNDEQLKNIFEANGVSDRIGERKDIIDGQLIPFLKTCRATDVSYKLSPRDIVALADLWEDYYEHYLSLRDDAINPIDEGLRRALDTRILGKFRTEEEKEDVNDEIQRSFGIRV